MENIPSPSSSALTCKQQPLTSSTRRTWWRHTLANSYRLSLRIYAKDKNNVDSNTPLVVFFFFFFLRASPPALGEGNFGKVRYARHVDSGLAFAVKILDRKRIQSLKIDDQVLLPEHASSGDLSLCSVGIRVK
ncbi:hypothetical protein BHM03_00040093 [Ensete ventricosum]|nr:hypothetical protein BHM03_00040093 [Ensete ventricosum]